MDLILIRHGRTEANDRKVFATHEEPLNTIGKRQVAELKPHIDAQYPIYASPYRRCQETANILFPEDEIITKEELREMSFGCLEGHSFVEIFESDAEGLQPWMKDPYTFGPPQGESIDEAYERVSKYIKSIEESSILVTHDGFIRLALCSILGSSKYFFNFYIENASKAVIRKVEDQYIIAGINLK